MALNAEILIRKVSDFDEIALRMLFLLEYPRVTIYQTGDKDNMGIRSSSVTRSLVTIWHRISRSAELLIICWLFTMAKVPELLPT